MFPKIHATRLISLPQLREKHAKMLLTAVCEAWCRCAAPASSRSRVAPGTIASGYFLILAKKKNHGRMCLISFLWKFTFDPPKKQCTKTQNLGGGGET